MSEHNLYVQNSLAMERFGSCSRNHQILWNHQQIVKKLLCVGTQKPFKGHKTCLNTYSWQSLLYVYLVFSSNCYKQCILLYNAYILTKKDCPWHNHSPHGCDLAGSKHWTQWLHYGTQLTDTHRGTTPIIWEINIITCNQWHKLHVHDESDLMFTPLLLANDMHPC